MTDDIDFKKEIGFLVRLQALDTEIYDLTSRKEEIPVKLKEMDDSLETKKGGVKSAEDKLKELQVAKNGKETEIQAIEEKINKQQAALYQIKNNKEYQALQQEIEGLKADVSLVEEAVINLLDEIEAAQAVCENEKKIYEEETLKVDKVKKSIEEEAKKLEGQLNELNAKRAELTAAINAEVLKQYEVIRKNRGRVALVEIRGECCGGCNMHLRPQLINAAALKKSIVYCENCSRMLYAKD